MPADNRAFDPAAVQPGQRLEPWIVEVTPSLIIAGALATRDAQDVRLNIRMTHYASTLRKFQTIGD